MSRTLEVKNRRELATLGIVRIKTSPSNYVERLADITTFKRTDGVLQIGTFSTPPQPADVASLIIDEADLKRLRECRVEDCEVRLSADDIERVRREIDWHAADASRKASLLVRQLLVDYVARYRQSGTAAAMDTRIALPRTNVGREFASLIDADTITSNYAPRLRRHLLEYPTSSADKMTDFVYWSKELVRGRPVISITHVATAPAVGRFTGGFRHWLEADLRDALLRRVAWADAAGARSHVDISGDLRRLPEPITNRLVRWSVWRRHAADCGRESPGVGCGAAPTTATHARQRPVAGHEIFRPITRQVRAERRRSA